MMPDCGPRGAVAVVEEGDVVYAATLPDGPIVVLDGGAAAIWVRRAAAAREPRSPSAWPTATDVPVDAVRPTWTRSSSELVDRACWTARGVTFVRSPGAPARRGTCDT